MLAVFISAHLKAEMVFHPPEGHTSIFPRVLDEHWYTLEAKQQPLCTYC